MPTQFAPEQLAAAFNEIIRSMPNRQTLSHDLPENHEWFGQAAALVTIADPLRGTIFKNEIDKIHSRGRDPHEPIQNIIVTLQQLKTEWQFKAGGPLTLAFEAGKPFDYYDEVRKIIEAATSDILVVDPYLGVEFFGRYLPFAKKNVKIRLLVEHKMTEVTEAARLFSTQYGSKIELRKSKDMHDRYIFIDKLACYHSGATFKDGAAKSATTLTQITDAFSAVATIYEQAWAVGTPQMI